MATIGTRWRKAAGVLAGAMLWVAVASVSATVSAPWVAALPLLPEGARAALGLIENFDPALALAASGATLAALLLRRRRAATLALAAAAVALTPVLASIHAAPEIAADAPRLKVMTFNLWVRNGDTGRIVAYLRAERPDIVFLEEATEAHKKALAALADLYPTQVTCHAGVAACETMLLARFPARWQKAGPIAGSMPSTAIALLDLGGGRTVTAVAVHLAWPFPMQGRDAQREQALHLARALDAYPGPLLIGGDFNGGGWAHNQDAVRTIARLTGEPGLHPSWPAIRYHGFDVPDWLRLPIDHLFARDGPVIASAGTGPKLGSDHLPMLAVVAFPADGR
ncbi:MAG TPA: endonuclease/exonuclease/phosphatase family protein [Dongiaceae bacterium]|nr:endonuclease/exonuclease/phosphatase family protein [Dongiaceae bacterium]